MTGVQTCALPISTGFDWLDLLAWRHLLAALLLWAVLLAIPAARKALRGLTLRRAATGVLIGALFTANASTSTRAPSASPLAPNALRAGHGFAATDVTRVDAEVGYGNARNLCYESPRNEMEARFSLQYCVAVALADHDALAQHEDVATCAVRLRPPRDEYRLGVVRDHARHELHVGFVDRADRGRGRLRRFTRSDWFPSVILLLVIALLGAYTYSVNQRVLTEFNIGSALTLLAALAFISFEIGRAHV